MDEAAPAAAAAEGSRRSVLRRADLLPALIGLLGVLVGALTTSGIAYLGARNARHADEKAATRLVAAEIQRDELALKNVIRYGEALPSEPFSSTTWRDQQVTLARQLNSREWADVAIFYAEFSVETQRIPIGRCVPVGVRQAAAAVIRVGESAMKDLGQQYKIPLTSAAKPDHRCAG